jgi:ABC-2 type transport system ATP-binding protein
MTAAIAARGLSRAFGGRPALRNVDLDVGEGRIVGLLGPSGSGKTTLIRCVAGLAAPDSGGAWVAGHPAGSRAALAAMGYMPQGDALYEELSGRRNLEFFASLHGLGKARAKARADRVLALVRLEGEGPKKVAHYSGGMRKRLSLAAALVNEPKILLLDEPTVGIDPALRGEFWEEFRRLASAGATLLVSTHVMDEAERCNELALVAEGRLVAYGSPSALKERAGAATVEGAFLALSRGEGGGR